MVLSLLLVLSVCARPGTGLPPRHMDSVLGLMEALDSSNPNQTLPELARALGACSTPGCRAVLGEPPSIPPALSPDQRALLTWLLHRDAVVLVPDGSTVALGPLLAGIEVGQKRGSGWPFPTFEPPIDPLYAVTITEALATSFLLARGGDGATLGPAGCWDDVDDPQNYTLLGPPSPIPDAVANGAMDGVLLGTRVAQAPIPLADLLRGYYGMGNATEQGRPRSSYRRRDFGVLMGPEKLEQEVEAMLRLLQVLTPTRELPQELGPEEAVTIAGRAARDFTQLYVDEGTPGSHFLLSFTGQKLHVPLSPRRCFMSPRRCFMSPRRCFMSPRRCSMSPRRCSMSPSLAECPPIVPRCMWGARPYRGTPRALTLPLESVFIHHTFIPSAPCRSFRSCSRAMRSMQRFHQDVRGWDDIGYSFVVGSDGYLYQGRGWHWVGAHTKGYNSKGYGVGYVGDFTSILPDPDTIALVRDQLLPCAVRTGRLHQNYTLRGHRQMGRTDCPGNSLFREIGTWSGFK